VVALWRDQAHTGIMTTARYIWRARINWEVVRLDPDGTERVYAIAKTEEEAKVEAAKMDKKAREGNE